MTEHPHEQGRVEGILEQVVARLDRLEDAHRQESAALRQEMTAIRQEMTALGQHINRCLDSQFRWLVGIQFGIVGLLVPILLKVL